MQLREKVSKLSDMVCKLELEGNKLGHVSSRDSVDCPSNAKLGDHKG